MQNIVRQVKRRLKSFLYTPTERRHSLVGPARLWEMKREFQIKFLKQVGLKPEHRLLDIGCGTLRGGIPIIEYLENGRYSGIEYREEVLDEGRKELRESGLAHKQPSLIAAKDISELNLGKKFDYIWAFSVLIHMKDNILYDTLKVIRQHLADTGYFYANVNIGDHPGGEWQGFPVVWRKLNFYEDACSNAGLKIEDIGPIKNFGHISRDAAQDKQRMLKIWKT